MVNPEVQELEQLNDGQSSEVDQSEFLSEQEISDKMDADPEFMKAVTSGAIDLMKGIRRDGKPVEESENEAATPANSEDDNTSEALEDQNTSEEDVVKVKVADLKYVSPSGREVKYKSVAQVLKSNKEKETFIEELLQDRKKAKDLETEVEQLRQKVKEREQNVQAGNTEGSGDLNPNADDDPYSPENLKRIGMTAREVAELKEKFAKLEREQEENKNKQEKSKILNKTFSEIEEFQNEFPEFKTKTPIPQIDEEYRSVLKRVGVLAKTDGSYKANIEAMRVYLEDEGEKGEQLRELAEKNGVRLPDEFDTYVEINRLRQEAAQKLKNPSLKEAYIIRKVQEGDFTPFNAGSERQLSDAENRAAMRKKGEENRQKFATDIPPSLSGEPTAVDAMTVDELERIIDETSEDDLRNNPQALKTYNAVMRRIGGKEVNPFARR